MRMVATIFATCLAVAALPVMIPFALAMNALFAVRLRAAVMRVACPECQGTLGTRAIGLSDAAFKAYATELHRLHPRARLRLVRLAQATCPHCDSQLRFDQASKTFRPVADVGILLSMYVPKPISNCCITEGRRLP